MEINRGRFSAAEMILEALGLVRDHIAAAFESLAMDAIRALLDGAGRQAPEEDRV